MAKKTIRPLYDWAEAENICPSFCPSDEFGPIERGDKYYAVDGFCFGDEAKADGPMAYGSNDVTLYNDGSYGYALADGTIYGDHKDIGFIKSLMLTYRDHGLKAAIEFARQSGDRVAVPLDELGIKAD